MSASRDHLLSLLPGERFRLSVPDPRVFEIVEVPNPTGADPLLFAVVEGDPDRRPYNVSQVASLNNSSYFVFAIPSPGVPKS